MSTATFFGSTANEDFMIRAVPEPGVLLQQLAILGLLACLVRTRRG